MLGVGDKRRQTHQTAPHSPRGVGGPEPKEWGPPLLRLGRQLVRSPETEDNFLAPSPSALVLIVVPHSSRVSLCFKRIGSALWGRKGLRRLGLSGGQTKPTPGFGPSCAFGWEL